MTMKIRGILLVLALAASASIAMAQSEPSANRSLTYTQALSAPGIRDVQQRLHRLGLYQGSIDGNWGANSAAALQQFQQTHGLQVTGQLNDATAKTLNLNLSKVLGVQPPPAKSNAGKGQNQSQGNATDNGPSGGSQGMGLSRQAIQSVQQRLRQLNFDVGPADGIWGADTQKALTKFQQGHGLQATGQLNPATIKALGLNANQVLMQNNSQ